MDADLKKLVSHYSCDFDEVEKTVLKSRLTNAMYQLIGEKDAEDLKTWKLQDVCSWLHEDLAAHQVVRKLCVLVCALPVSSASCERVFSGLKTIKSRLRSTMGGEFLSDLLTVYMEKDLLKKIVQDDEELEKVVDIFKRMGERKAEL